MPPPTGHIGNFIFKMEYIGLDRTGSDKITDFVMKGHVVVII